MYKQIVLFLVFCLFSTNTYSSSKTDIDSAIYFVEQTNLGRNLYNLSYRSIMLTQTYQMISLEFGVTRASKIINKELRVVTKKYQQQWNENLAFAYLEYFTPAELNSLLKKKKNSPYIQKMVSRQKDVGISMQKKSKQILADVMSETLINALSQVEKN